MEDNVQMTVVSMENESSLKKFGNFTLWYMYENAIMNKACIL